MKNERLIALSESESELLYRLSILPIKILDGTGLPLTSDTLDLIQHEASDELIREWASKKKLQS